MTTLLYGENPWLFKGLSSPMSDTLFDHGWNVTGPLAQLSPPEESLLWRRLTR